MSAFLKSNPGMPSVVCVVSEMDECSTSGVQDGCEMGALQRGSWMAGAGSVAGRRSRDVVFVSCSEAEEGGFVGRLCSDLDRAELRPVVIGKGEKSGKDCGVAIVVVSEDYFTHGEWLMTDLVALVESRACEVLPLFWGLSRAEFGDAIRRERWFRVWESWREVTQSAGVSVDGWKRALRELEGGRGLEYANSIGGADFRKEAVALVCRKLHQISLDEEIDVEKAVSSGGLDLQRPGEGADRRRGWWYYFRLVLLTPVIIVSVIFVGSVLYSAFFCDQGYPSPYGIIFPTMI